MKKLSIVVLVLLLVSMVTYGTDFWRYGVGPDLIWPVSGINKVGIGTGMPGYPLTVEGEMWQGDANAYLGMDGGNVGIGATNPVTKLQVNFNSGTSLTGTSAFAGIHLNPSNTNDDFVGITSDAPNASGQVTQAGILFQGSGSYGTKIHFLTTDSYAAGMKQRMIIDHLGNVGIGTDEPQSELAVNGTITTKEIIVTEEGWSDFVFADNYNLMPLNRLEQHIKANKSLPGIPTEKEVLKSGVKVGEMQAKFLEKIEELTLYVIELKKENEELKERISILERQ